MIEPPGHPRRTGILEIDNGVLIAVEQPVRELLPGLMRHARKLELRAGVDPLAKKAVEDRRRGRSVEAAVVKTQTNFYRVRQCPSTLPFQIALQISIRYDRFHARGSLIARSAKRKALKDGWGDQKCQDEKDRSKGQSEQVKLIFVGQARVPVLQNPVLGQTDPKPGRRMTNGFQNEDRGDCPEWKQRRPAPSKNYSLGSGPPDLAFGVSFRQNSSRCLPPLAPQILRPGKLSP